MEISARFSHDKLDPSKDNTPHLVVTVTAPTLDWVAKRPALCVVPVIDLSGSMRGAKLDYAKQSMLKLVDQLKPGDIAGLIGFEDRTHTLVQPALVTAELKAKLKDEITKLKPLGGTNLCEGILDTLAAISRLDLGPQFLKRAIIFTDGQPTKGVMDLKQILRLTTENRGSVTVSAFGYGDESNDQWSGCDHKFLTDFAKEGQGNYAYVKNPDDALTAFGRELGGLLSTYAQDIVVEIEPEHGHQLVRAVTDVAIEQNALGETDFRFPEILSEETRHFVFDTKIVKQPDGFKPMPRPLNAFKVKVSYTTLTEQGTRETKEVEAKAQIRFVPSGEEQKEPSKELDGIIAMAQVVRAQLQAEEQAKRGDFTKAAAIMGEVGASVSSRGHNGHGKIAQALRQRLSSREAYAHNQGYLRTTAYAGTRAYGMSSMDGDAAADLLGCNVSLSNASMSHSTNQFTGEGNGAPLWKGPQPHDLHSVQVGGVVVPTPTLAPMQAPVGGVFTLDPTAALISLTGIDRPNEPAPSGTDKSE